MGRRPTRTLVLNGILAGVVLLFVFTLLESGARLYLYGAFVLPVPSTHADCFVAHPERGWTMRPNAVLHLRTPDFQVTTYTNSRGMNDEEHSYAKEPGVFRIVLLGDSFMFGREVRRDEGLAALLEAGPWGRRVEVINLGVVAYGTIQEYLYLVEEGLRYDPDLVLLGMYPLNDICDNSEVLNQEMWGDIGLTWGRPYLVHDAQPDSFNLRFPDAQRMQASLDKYRANQARAVAAATDRLAILRLMSRAWMGLRGEFRMPAVDPQLLYGVLISWPSGSERSQIWNDAWRDTSTALGAIKEAASAHGTPMVLFSIPGRVQVDPELEGTLRALLAGVSLQPQLPQERVQELAKTHGVPSFDLLPGFRAAVESGGGPYYFSLEDMHWNHEGHRLAADLIGGWLREAKLVPPGPDDREPD